ncbi:MAG: hypothetical protein ABI175_00675 [Polyangiales bacterium]
MLASVVMASSWSSGCCSAIGCSSGTVYSGALTLPDPMHRLLLTVCRNSECSTTPFQVTTRGDASPGPTTGTPRADILLLRAPSRAQISTTIERDQLHDGDVYRIKVEDLTAGALLLDFASAPVHYERKEICNGYCLHAQLVAK